VRVELVITVNVESILSVTAREIKTGREASVQIRPSGGLSQKEIVEIITRRRHESSASTSKAPLEGGHVRVTTREQMVSKIDPDNDDPDK
jgi:molecular chaperone DnaK (HSP70)